MAQASENYCHRTISVPACGVVSRDISCSAIAKNRRTHSQQALSSSSFRALYSPVLYCSLGVESLRSAYNSLLFSRGFAHILRALSVLVRQCPSNGLLLSFLQAKAFAWSIFSLASCDERSAKNRLKYYSNNSKIQIVKRKKKSRKTSKKKMYQFAIE